MAKGYWIACVRAVHDADAVAEYARLARPVLESFGGRYRVRGTPTRVLEGGIAQRTVIIEFDSPEQAIAAYESPGYQAALEVLGDSIERDLRIVEGCD